jgi:hypothetical protein
LCLLSLSGQYRFLVAGMRIYLLKYKYRKKGALAHVKRSHEKTKGLDYLEVVTFYSADELEGLGKKKKKAARGQKCGNSAAAAYRSGTEAPRRQAGAQKTASAASLTILRDYYGDVLWQGGRCRAHSSNKPSTSRAWRRARIDKRRRD